MILVDTSVWVGHLRDGDPELSKRLDAGVVATHPSVIGELALENLRRRELILRLLHDLPQAAVATDREVLHLIERTPLYGAGVGYIDAQLLASARLTPGATLWTHDKRLLSVARGMGLAAPPPAGS